MNRSPAPAETEPAPEVAAVRAAVAAARAAQPEWGALPFAVRAEQLYRFRDQLMDHEEEVLDTLTAETGKVRTEALVELIYVADLIGYYGRNGARFLAERRPYPHLPLLWLKQLKVAYRPRGVVGVIGPWNYPLMLTIGDAVPALLAGNAVVIKPSPVTPRTAGLGARLWAAAGGPAALLQAVAGGAAAGGELIDQADYIMFTGSTRTGRQVMARAAQTLTPVSLELGGKDPMIVLADADVARAAAGAAYGGLFNAGQTCISIERVYVEQPVHDRFVAAVLREVAALRPAFRAPDPWAAELGAMTFPPQVELVERHVADAVARGARVLTGGRRSPEQPMFYEPTVLVNVNHEMLVMREETFGPVLPIMAVRDEEEAIRLANDSPYGLAASVWSRDRRRAERVARRLRAGSCCINDVLINFVACELPLGGWQQSGIGVRHGPEGIRKYCREQSLLVDRAGLGRELHWYPYTPGKAGLLRRVARLLLGRGWRRWAK